MSVAAFRLFTLLRENNAPAAQRSNKGEEDAAAFANASAV